MEIIKIRDDFIKLGQALKLAGLVESGVDAKIEVQEGQVKKVHPGDVIEYGGQQVRVEN